MKVPKWKPMETEGGNTISPSEQDKSSKKRQVPSRYWCFTSYEDEMEMMEIILKSFSKTKEYRYICGREICPTTDKKHLQGYVESDKKFRPIECFGTKTTHWEHRAKDATTEDNIVYCSKDKEFITNFPIRKKIINPMDNQIWKDWQLDIVKIIEGPIDNRKIYVFVDQKGGAGKSTLAKHIVMNYNAMVSGGKASDVKYAVSQWILEKDLDIVIWDLPRSVDSISWNAIEELKNGMFFSTKYESGMSIFNTPHILIFTNTLPDESKLSEDRWDIRFISDYVYEDLM